MMLINMAGSMNIVMLC